MAAALLVLAACKKEKEPASVPPPASPVIGFWQGSYTTTGLLGSSKYAMLINEGGVGRVYDLGTESDTNAIPAGKKPNLVWTLTGNTLQTSYLSGAKTVNTTATVNAAYNNQTGTWSFNGVTKGNITLNK